MLENLVRCFVLEKWVSRCDESIFGENFSGLDDRIYFLTLHDAIFQLASKQIVEFKVNKLLVFHSTKLC